MTVTTRPRLARLADECASLLSYRRLCQAAHDWPAAANDNDRRVELPAPAAAEDVAGKRAQAKLDDRPSLPFLEALRHADGSWDMSRLEFHSRLKQDDGEPRYGTLLRFFTGGKWRAAREAFGASQSAKLTHDNDNDSEPTPLTAAPAPRREAFGGGAPSPFEWSPRYTTEAQRAAWRAQIGALGVSGAFPLSEACARHDLVPVASALGPRTPVQHFHVRTVVDENEEDEPALLLGGGAPLAPDPTWREAEEELRELERRLGPTTVRILRSAATAQTMADVGRSTQAQARERWASIVGERLLLQAVGELRAAMTSMRNEALLTAA